jgi:hypothetical protein
MKIVEGTLVKIKKSGRFATVVRRTYTHRFMDSEQDWVMMENGMGHLAGSYGGAFDVVFTDNGQRKRISIGDRGFEVMTSPEEAALA